MPANDPWSAAPAADHAPRSRMKTILIALVILILAVVVGVALWTTGRYQQSVAVAKKAQEQYASLNKQFPFAPPGSGKTLPAARWQALLRVHERVQRQASPELRRNLSLLLEGASLKDPRLYAELLAGIPRLQPLLNEQYSALLTEQMSAREYQWMLGLVLVKVLEAPERYPDGAGAWSVLKKLERLTHADADPGNDVDAQKVFDFFRATYRDAPAPDAATLQALGTPDEPASAIDLLMAAAQWAAPEGAPSEGMLRNLLPR